MFLKYQGVNPYYNKTFVSEVLLYTRKTTEVDEQARSLSQTQADFSPAPSICKRTKRQRKWEIRDKNWVWNKTTVKLSYFSSQAGLKQIWTTLTKKRGGVWRGGDSLLMTTNICLCSSLHSFTFDLQRLERQKGTESTGNSAIMLNTHTCVWFLHRHVWT